MSPIWQVKQSALTCPSRPRTAQLALPKEPHKDYEPNREVSLNNLCRNTILRMRSELVKVRSEKALKYNSEACKWH